MLSFVAILFGIGYTRLLNIVPDVFSKNEKSNLTFQLFYIYVFFAGILHFWGFTNNLGIENYNFGLFCLDVILSCTIYALCALTCPNNVEKIESWRDHYIKVRSKVWICQFLLIANKALLGVIVPQNEEQQFITYIVVLLPWLTFSCLGFFFKNMTIQLITIILSLAHTTMAAFATLLSEASGLTN
tara:strand:+ start:256 stop:813 length:558 start_codon:yes stop_codon:yes gene_type:complete